jgi:polyisoprenyl-phosphate glycosyltransferase
LEPKKSLISIVIPSFNEAENIPLLLDEVSRWMPPSLEFEMLFVDDGSSDETALVLKKIAQQNAKVKYLLLSKNFGHQHALKAGIDHAKGDAVICMDGDLQHPPAVIPLMIEKWQKEGYEVVYTIRKDDKELSFLKRKTSALFYKLMNAFTDIELKQGAADFRLIDRKLVEEIKKLNDPFLFIRGLIPWMGFKQFELEYIPGKRIHGVTKYTFRKMFRFAINGITSFSIKPLRFAIVMGFSISLLSFLYGIYAIVIYLLDDKAISGWASMITSVVFLGGLQLIILGIIGEYIGKIYVQLKNRPTYIVKEKN